MQSDGEKSTQPLWTNAANQNLNRKNCECCPRHSLFKGHNEIVDIVVLNCKKCIQWHKCQVSGNKFLGLLFEEVVEVVEVAEVVEVIKVVKVVEVITDVQVVEAYLIFVTSSDGVKIFRLVSKRCELVCFGVKITIFVFFWCQKVWNLCVFGVS